MAEQWVAFGFVASMLLGGAAALGGMLLLGQWMEKRRYRDHSARYKPGARV